MQEDINLQLDLYTIQPSHGWLLLMLNYFNRNKYPQIIISEELKEWHKTLWDFLFRPRNGFKLQTYCQLKTLIIGNIFQVEKIDNYEHKTSRKIANIACWKYNYYRNIFSFMDRLPKKVIDTYIDIPRLKKSDNYKYISLANKIDA